jgi:hypothetical protein
MNQLNGASLMTFPSGNAQPTESLLLADMKNQLGL